MDVFPQIYVLNSVPRILRAQTYSPSDGLLLPFYNVRRCFRPHISLYLCSRLSTTGKDGGSKRPCARLVAGPYIRLSGVLNISGSVLLCLLSCLDNISPCQHLLLRYRETKMPWKMIHARISSKIKPLVFQLN